MTGGETLLNEREMDFILYEFLDTGELFARPRYQEHSRELYGQILDVARTIATKYFANHYQEGDANEPTFDGKTVTLIPETQAAWDACAKAGFLTAHCDEAEGGQQLPEVIFRAATAYLTAGNGPTFSYMFLTIAAANLIRTFGSKAQKALYLPPMMDGRCAGTMAMTEPGQGSSLADINTTAEPAGNGTYRLKGQKMFISAGDHELTGNIVHMVLARIKGAPAGVRGISLFIVPKVLINPDGSPGARNDVVLAGLLHKMGNRNTTSTVLNFGENKGAVAHLVGEPNQGLTYMFHMMNEARIGVGMGAAVQAYQGYRYSLDYARQRPQGRLPSSKDPEKPQCMIIEHGDVKRMLLAQKAYSEGALALCFYACSLFEDAQTAETAAEQQRAQILLDLLTPLVKSWPSRYGCHTNDLAIQVMGGAGYINDHPVEQLYRDQRLNPIHEGTEGIQAIDLLGRKIPMQNQFPYTILKQEIRITLQLADQYAQTKHYPTAFEQAISQLDRVTQCLMQQIARSPDKGLANASIYMDLFGRVVIAWIWLRQAVKAARVLNNKKKPAKPDMDFYQGKLQTAKYYIDWELPQVQWQVELLSRGDTTCFDMEDAWF